MSMMSLEAAEPSSTEAGFDSRSQQSDQLLQQQTEADFPTPVELHDPACRTSRRKRIRAAAPEALLMETSRKRSCGFDGRAATMKSTFSGHPESARKLSRQDQEDEDWMSRRHLRRRRPRSAIRTEYLGVSGAAFAPPLRRYLESPQHGRRALRRSTTPSSATWGIAQSPFRSSRRAAGKSRSATTSMCHVGRPISRGTKERDRQARFYAQQDSASSSKDLSGGHHATLVNVDVDESLDDISEPGVTQPTDRCRGPGLLTPVGPDWWEAASGNQAENEQSPPSAEIDDGGDSSIGIDEQLLMRRGGGHLSDSDENVEDESGSRHSSQQEPRRSSGCSEDKREPTSRHDESPSTPTVRGTHRRRRVLRSSAWDLLTGRRMERGRRKGSRDIHISHLAGHDWMPQPDTSLIHVLGETLPRVWQPSQTSPLEYPTSTVKRGVTRFHEQIQRTRLMEGKAPLERLPAVEDPGTGVRLVTTRHRVQGLPPPLSWPEEQGLTPGDILVTVEHCAACARHHMSLHHKAEVYMQRAALVKATVEQALADMGRKTSVVTKPIAERSATGGVGRVGAFEVQVTACLLAQKADPATTISRRGMSSQSAQTGGAGRARVVRSSTVSSKLSSGKWPRPKGVANNVVRILRQWGALQQQPQHHQQQQQQQVFIGISQRGGLNETAGAGGKNGPSEGTAEHPQPVAHSPPSRVNTTNGSAVGTATGSEAFGTKAALGQSSSDKAAREGQDTRHPTGVVAASEGDATGGAQVRPESREGGAAEDGGVSGRGNGESNATGISTPSQPVSVADNTGKSEAVAGRATGTETLELFGLSVEDAFVEGVEFAAEGGTADPCFLLRVGKRKGKSDPVADVPGGSGGHCRWPAQTTCVVTGVAEADVRFLGFEVEVWDELGWIIAKGAVTPQDAGAALDSALLAVGTTAGPVVTEMKTGVSPPPPHAVTCALKSARGTATAGEGRATFRVRVVRPTHPPSDAHRSEKEKRTAMRGSATVACSAFEGIEDLLGFSPHGHGSGSSFASSSGTTATAESGEVSSTLRRDLLGSGAAAVDHPLDESWSSAEERDEPDSSNSAGKETNHTAVALPQKLPVSAVDVAAATASADAKASGKAAHEPAERGKEELLPSPTSVAATTAELVEASPGIPPSPSLGRDQDVVQLPLQNGSVADSGYSDDGFDYEHDDGDEEAAGASAAPSPFSFSGASSSASSFDHDVDDDDGSNASRDEERRARQHIRDEMVVASAAARLRRRLLRAIAKCSVGGVGGEESRATRLFDRLDEDQDGQLTALELQRVFPRTNGDKPEQDQGLPPAHVAAALVAGMDRVGKRSANAREFEAFLFGSGATAAGGVEMAALWLRLRRAVIDDSTICAPRRHHHPEDPDLQAQPAAGVGVSGKGGGGRIGQVREDSEKEGSRGEASGDAFGLEGGAVDLSRVGAGFFRERDSDGSGSVSSEIFSEVIGGPDVQIEPPLLGPEIEAICRHFGSNPNTQDPTGGSPAEIAVPRCRGHATVSYRTFLAWIDPVDVGRVAKRVSRFLRAVGDPASKFGRSIAPTSASSMVAVQGDEEQTAMSKSTATGNPDAEASRVGESGSLLLSGMPAAIEVMGKGLRLGKSGVSGGCTGGIVEGVSERRAIADVFRKVDLDASGHVSEEELVEGVNRLGLPVTEAEARLLVVEYGGAAGGVSSNGDGKRRQTEGDGEGQLSLDDFDFMIRRHSRVMITRTWSGAP